MKCEIATRCVAASAGQDRVFFQISDDVAIIAVADGAGGRAGGGEAADILVREAANIAQNLRNPRDTNAWRKWLREVDILIRDDALVGETTAVIAAIGADFVAGASVGDSSIWLIGEQVWRDLSENQVRKPTLGVEGASPVAFSARLDEQIVLLATDGLTKYADWDTIAQIARGAEIETAADELIAVARYPSGALGDDVSCVLWRVATEDRSAPHKKRFGIF